MTDRTISVIIGGRSFFELLPGGMILMPTTKSERADTVNALQSALRIFETSGGDIALPPRNAVNADVAHEVHEIAPTVKAMPIPSHKDGWAPHPTSPERNSPVTF